MTPLFHLAQNLTMRMVGPEDHALIGAWIEGDPEHRDTCDVDFFSRLAPTQECYMVEDDDGPLFVLKTTRAIRLDVQFGPADMRARMRRGLIEGFPPLAKLLASRNFAEVICESKNPRLMRSLEKRLGFKRSPGEMVRALRKEA